MTKDDLPKKKRKKRKYTRRVTKPMPTPIGLSNNPSEPSRRAIRLSGMTLSMWQESKARTVWADDMIQKDPNFQDMLSILANASVSPKVENLDMSKAAYYLGVEMGMKQARAIIYALANYAESRIESEADYGEDPTPPMPTGQE